MRSLILFELVLFLYQRTMLKKTTLFIFALTLIGCSSSDESIPSDPQNNEPETPCHYEDSNPPNLSQSSYELFDISYPLRPDGEVNMDMLYHIGDTWEYGFGGVYIDYNNDGIKDVMGYRNDYDNHVDYPDGYTGYERKKPIRFFLGDCDGNFVPDPTNDHMFLGLVHGRKLLYGDFNQDQYVDFFLIGHGYDKQPFPGEFVKVLMSNGLGGFVETEFSSLVSFYHGGASGDIDNDGDLDVLVVEAGGGKSAIYLNENGVLSPNLDMIDQSLMFGMFNAELFDINKDGFLDIICGGHDWGNQPEYDNTPLIIYGNGGSYTQNQFVRLPATEIFGQGVVTDFNFYDLNGNGKYEIIITRTGDNILSNSNFYLGWSIQILKENMDGYVDATEEFINENSSPNGSWFRWAHFKDYDNDGKVEFYNTFFPSSPEYAEWELNQGFLSRVQ